MSTSLEAARPWRMCSAPSARQIPRPKIRQTLRRSSMSSAVSPSLEQGPDEPNTPVSDRSGNRGELGVGEPAAVKTGEDDPVGLASCPAKGLERLLASLEMGDHCSSLLGPCPGPGDQKTGNEPDAGGSRRRL